MSVEGETLDCEDQYVFVTERSVPAVLSMLTGQTTDQITQTLNDAEIKSAPLMSLLGITSATNDLIAQEVVVPEDNGMNYQKTETYSPMNNGNILYWHLIMHILLTAKKEDLNFKLAFNHKDSRDFGDIYFNYETASGEVEHLHMKIVTSESKKIKFTSYINSEVLQNCVQISKNEGEKCNFVLYACQDFETEEINNKMLGVENKNVLVNEEFFQKATNNIQYPVILNEKNVYKINEKSSKKLIDMFSNDEFLNVILKNNIYFAVNQKNVKNLKEIIKNDIMILCQIYNDNKMIKIKYEKLLNWVQNWMEKCEGNFIDKNILDIFLDTINFQSYININTAPRKVVPNFSCRGRELEEASAILSSCDMNPIDLVISGQSGVGKSELVLKIIEIEKNRYDHIIWIDSTNIKSIENSFLNISNKLHIYVKKLIINKTKINFDSILKNIYRLLSNYKTLIIFDDVNQYSDINTFLPSIYNIESDSINIIVTTQNASIKSRININLEPFSLWESFNFVVKELDLENDTNVGSLVKKLQNLPQAINIVISFIKFKRKKVKNYSVSDYLNIDIIKKMSEDICYEKLVKTLLNVSLKSIRQITNGALLIRYLEIMCLMNHYQIPIKIFEKLNTDYMNILEILEEYSFIQITNNFCSLDKRLQMYLRDNFSKQQMNYILSNLLQLLALNADDIKFNIIEIVPHAITAWNYALNFTNIIKNYSNIPLLIVNTVHNGRNNIIFIDTTINKTEEILTWKNKNLHNLYQEYIKLLFKEKIYLKAEKICEKYLQKIPLNCNSFVYKMDVLMYKAKCKYNLELYIECWQVWHYIYCQSEKVLGFDSKETVESLQNIWNTTYNLYQINEYEYIYKFISILQIRFSDTRSKFDLNLEVLSTMTSQINFETVDNKCKVISLILEILELKYGTTHSLYVYLLLVKAHCLCIEERHDEAWLIYKKICLIWNLYVGKQFTDLKDFLQMLLHDLSEYLDLSQGIVNMVVQILQQNAGIVNFLLLETKLKEMLIGRTSLIQVGSSDVVDIDSNSNYDATQLSQSLPNYNTWKLKGHQKCKNRVNSDDTDATTISKLDDYHPQRDPTLNSARTQTDKSAHHYSLPSTSNIKLPETPILTRKNVRKSSASSFQSLDKLPQIEEDIILAITDQVTVTSSKSDEIKQICHSIRKFYREENYREVIIHCDIVLSNIETKEDVALEMLYYKAQSLHNRTNYQESGEIWYDLYMNYEKLKGIDDMNTIKSLIGMCKSVIKLSTHKESPMWETWLQITKSRLKDYYLDHKKSLDIINKVESYLRMEDKSDLCIELYSILHFTVESVRDQNDSLALCILLAKAECYWHSRREYEAWETYSQVCDILNSKECSHQIMPGRSQIFVLISTLRHNLQDFIYM